MLLRYTLFVVAFSFFHFLPAQNFVVLGDINTQDEGNKIVQTSDGHFLVAGRVGGDAVLYKIDCSGAVVDSLRKDLGGVEDFYDVVELLNGEVLAVGYTKTGNFSSALLLRATADLQELNFDTLKINGKEAEAHSIAHTGAQWIVGGIVAGSGLDFVDGFTTRFNPASLALTGSVAVFSYGVDNLNRVSTTSDGGLLISGGSFVGDIFDPEAVLLQRAFVRKTKPDGSLIWEHIEEQMVKTKFGLTYFSDALENPLTGNLLAAGRCLGDTTANFMDACYTLLSAAGDSLGGLTLPRLGPENIYQTIATADPTYGTVFTSVGDSVGLYYNTPIVVALAELPDSTLIYYAFGNAIPLSPRTVIQVAGISVYGGVFYSAGGPTGVNQDLLVITPPPLDSALIERFGNTLEASQPEGSDLQYQWYLNDAPIPGATEMSLTFDTADYGLYSVVVTGPTGCTSQATYDVLVAAGEPGLANGVRVFPNPFSGQIIVEGGSGEEATLTLLDATGRRVRVLREAWLGERQVFDLTNLPLGVYGLEVQTASQLKVIKVIKGN